MNHAITELLIAAENAENNAPIHEAEGNHAQAALCREVAKDCRETIAKLEAA